MSHTQTLEFALQTTYDASDILLKYFGEISSYQKKDTKNNLVTIADTETEDFIIDKIRSKFPKHDIISEETDFSKGNSDYRWVIDPLDGTTNFVHNLPIFAISIALQYKEETIIGVVYNPAAKKCFSAEINCGAKLNNTLITPTSTNTLTESLLVTGFPYIHDDRWTKSFELFKTFYRNCQGVRRLGAAALDFCFVAMGRFEGYWEFGLQPWDICAGALILKESGGKVSDWNGSPMPFSGVRVLATNGHIHNEMLDILNKNLL